MNKFIFQKAKVFFNIMSLLGLGLSLFSLRASAEGVFENFDSYASGSNLPGQGGWTGWLGDSRYVGPISSLYSLSPNNSLFVNNSSTDVVLPFTSVNSGQWTLSFWQYIENSSAHSGIGLLNEYPPVGIPGSYNVVIEIDLWGNTVGDYFRGNVAQAIEQRWVENRFEMDFDANSFSWFYDGNHVQSGTWHTAGRTPSLGALELWGEGARVYYDNIALVPVPEPGCLSIFGFGAIVWAASVRKQSK